MVYHCFGYNLFLFLFLSTIIIMQIQYHFGLTSAQDPNFKFYCSSTGGNFTANSTYQANLNYFLTSLTSKYIPVKKNGYYNTTIGRNPNTVYGSFQCRGDIPPQRCQDCVHTTARQIIHRDKCPNSKGAFIYYDECILRYSSQYFFSIMQEPEPRGFLWNINNVTEVESHQFDRILVGLIDDLLREAGSRSSEIGFFASGERAYSKKSDVNKKIYGLVQCTSDSSQRSCINCLRESIFNTMKCCDGAKQGGRVIAHMCYFRYEIYPFYLSKSNDDNLAQNPNKNSKGRREIKLLVIIVLSVITVVLLFSIAIWYYFRKRKVTKQIDEHCYEIQGVESLQFEFNTLRSATNNFSDANKLGQGGFGSVYKGTLSDGQEIAVKRLSKNSGQGEKEFMNEAVLVVKLQHRNLTRLLGFCLHGDERLLVYEFMPNASLDQFIFDPIKRAYLDWERRYKIIGGIARGLLYLHEDSRLQIVHRDVKASNVLLGADMNPKISDFGMARSFMVDQSQACTNKIVGTYGYMAPEYAMHGHFSVKSDVFSFGVLILEILSGRRNNSFYKSEDVLNLLCYAWRHWKNGTALELLDPNLRDCYSRSEVMRCIHIGLLCVQDDVAERPTMASVVHKLNNYSISLPLPSSPPGFFVNKYHLEENVTVNEASISAVCPR